MNQQTLEQLLGDYRRIQAYLGHPDRPLTLDGIDQVLKRMRSELAQVQKTGILVTPLSELKAMNAALRRLFAYDDAFLATLHGYAQGEPQFYQEPPANLDPEFRDPGSESHKTLGSFVAQVWHHRRPSATPSWEGFENVSPWALLGAVALFLVYLWVWFSTAPPWWNRG